MCSAEGSLGSGVRPSIFGKGLVTRMLLFIWRLRGLEYLAGSGVKELCESGHGRRALTLPMSGCHQLVGKPTHTIRNALEKFLTIYIWAKTNLFDSGYKVMMFLPFGGAFNVD